MALEITKSQLEGMIADQIKSKFGLTPEQIEEALKAATEARKAEEESSRRYTVGDGALAYVDKGYASHARHIMASDTHKGVGMRLGRFLRCVAAAKAMNKSLEDVARNDLRSGWLADDIANAKALSATGGMSAGGAVVPDEYVGELIELLRAKTVVREAGAIQIMMETGQMTMPRHTGGATASYGAEGDNITVSDPTFGQENLTAHKLTAATAVSNDLLRQSDPSADQIVRDDLIRVMSLRQDLAFIRGDGTSNEPRGMRYSATSANVNGSAGTSLANKVSDLIEQVNLLDSGDVTMDRPVWLMHPRSKWSLYSTLDSNGNFVFANMLDRGVLFGFPVFTTTQIPNNLGGGSDESEVYFAEMSQVVIADTLTMSVEIFENGAYHDGSTVVSGISTDQTVIRAIASHDFMLRHDEAVSITTGVQWTT